MKYFIYLLFYDHDTFYIHNMNFIYSKINNSFGYNMYDLILKIRYKRSFEMSINKSLILFGYQYTCFKQNYIHLSNSKPQIRNRLNQFTFI